MTYQQGWRNPFHFAEELHTLGALYETMLREMRDAAGDSGEFYTPRAVVRSWWRLPTRALARPCSIPPAAQAASWWRHSITSRKQVKTVADRKRLQTEDPHWLRTQVSAVSARADELLLHGLDTPQIDPENALRFKLNRNRRERSRGRDPHQPALRRRRGEGHPRQFPEDRQAAETAFSSSNSSCAN